MKRVGLSLFVALVFALSFGMGSSFAAEGSHTEMEGSHMQGSHDKMECPYCKMVSSHVMEHIQTLRDAAKALKASDPALSKKLTDMADMKESMMMKMKDDMKDHMKSDNMEKIPEGSH